MLSSLSKRSPVILRLFLTAVSALSAICFASAFTLAPSAPKTPSQAASPFHPVSNTSAAGAPAPAPQNRVTVQAGETLSGISGGICGTPDDWSGFYAANRNIIRDPDLIEAGWSLKINCADPGYTPPAPKPVQDAVRPVTVAAAVSQPAQQGHYTGSSAMQQCIISRESGGNPYIWNASGHWGLYQFSAQTWAAHGGNPADFGHAPVAEQNTVYANTVAADGYSDWAPYDGCGA
jgi:Transglycosylase-like domain/LysM domain